MATPLSDETKTVLKLLSDGKWHRLDDILARVGTTIAPGKAARAYRRAYEQYHAKFERVGPELPLEEQIASGRRRLARVAIKSLSRRYLEFRDTDDGQREVRRRDNPLPVKTKTGTSPEPDPEPDTPAADICTRCGSHIADQALHDEFHAVYDAMLPPDVAFMSESQLRGIVREEVSGALDDFQRGMEQYLANQFHNLEQSGLPSIFRGRRDRGGKDRSERRAARV